MGERDELAKAAMHGILSGDPYMIWKDGRLETSKVAELAYEMAEEMLRKRPIPPPTPMPSSGVPRRIP